MIAAMLVALALQPGHYFSKGGSASFSLSAGPNGGLRFHMLAVGGDGSNCTLEGTVAAGQDTAMIEGLNKGEACVVSFKVLPSGGMAIGALDQALCQELCGAPASFVGTYEKVAMDCQAAVVSSSLADARQQLKAQEYAKAKAGLSTLLSSCGAYLPWTQKDWAITELALALHHLGDDKACLKALAPYKALMQSSDEKIRTDFPAFEAVMKLQLAKAMRANAKLCGKK